MLSSASSFIPRAPRYELWVSWR